MRCPGGNASRASVATSALPPARTSSRTWCLRHAGDDVPACPCPVYTDIEYYATATFSASGSQLNPAQRVVSSPVSTAKTPSQTKAAKKSYDKKLKAYKKAISPTSTTVNQLQNYIAPTPYTLNALLNSSHQV